MSAELAKEVTSNFEELNYAVSEVNIPLLEAAKIKAIEFLSSHKERVSKNSSATISQFFTNPEKKNETLNKLENKLDQSITTATELTKRISSLHERLKTIVRLDPNYKEKENKRRSLSEEIKAKVFRKKVIIKEPEKESFDESKKLKETKKIEGEKGKKLDTDLLGGDIDVDSYAQQIARLATHDSQVSDVSEKQD
eukprot:snap_masked-scaffold_31-processed-gene-2.50-mRNA-1 protein AED:1.00 eAED:1.00 QI:0/-1/0/0/-1/1/1/0/195